MSSEVTCCVPHHIPGLRLCFSPEFCLWSHSHDPFASQYMYILTYTCVHKHIHLHAEHTHTSHGRTLTRRSGQTTVASCQQRMCRPLQRVSCCSVVVLRLELFGGNTSKGEISLALLHLPWPEQVQACLVRISFKN